MCTEEMKLESVGVSDDPDEAVTDEKLSPVWWHL